MKTNIKESILIMVIVILVILIAVPIFINIFSDKKASGEEIYSLFIQTLKDYNNRYEDDLWCLDGESDGKCLYSGEIFIDLNEDIGYYDEHEALSTVKDIDLGDCLLADGEALSIVRGTNGDYNYNARIICSKDFSDRNYSIAETSDLENNNIYYRSGE